MTSESGSQWKSRKGKEVSSASASVNVETKGSNVIFPKLTVSPLRRFQLIDSDSDDPSVIEDTDKEMPRVILSPKDKQSDSRKQAALSNQGTKTSIGTYQNKDLWKDFCSEKSSRIPTPAFDEVCEEYFTNVKNKSIPENDCKVTGNGRKWDETSLPPAHCYFFHNDSRIQKLVRDRLPYFFPLGAGNNQEYKQQNASVIDYMYVKLLTFFSFLIIFFYLHEFSFESVNLSSGANLVMKGILNEQIEGRMLRKAPQEARKVLRIHRLAAYH